MTYRNHYENLTSALQKLCYLSETTLRNAKPPSFVPCGGLFGFNGLSLPAHRQKERTVAEKNQVVTCAVSFRRALVFRDLDYILDSYSAHPLNKHVSELRLIPRSHWSLQMFLVRSWLVIGALM